MKSIQQALLAAALLCALVAMPLGAASFSSIQTDLEFNHLILEGDTGGNLAAISTDFLGNTSTTGTVMLAGQTSEYDVAATLTTSAGGGLSTGGLFEISFTDVTVECIASGGCFESFNLDFAVYLFDVVGLPASFPVSGSLDGSLTGGEDINMDLSFGVSQSTGTIGGPYTSAFSSFPSFTHTGNSTFSFGLFKGTANVNPANVNVLRIGGDLFSNYGLNSSAQMAFGQVLNYPGSLDVQIPLPSTAIPEPSTYLLMLGGLGALAWTRRRNS